MTNVASYALPMRSLGVDVGLSKGLDLVLLDERREVIAFEARLAHASFRRVVLDWSPDIVAMDSPPRWAPPEGTRETERAVRRLGIQLYATPAEERRSLKGFHDWMIAGMEAFRAMEDLYPLFDGSSAGRHAMEVFPHATAVVLAGCLRPVEDVKHAWRRGVLAQRGVEDARLSSPDLIDAALASLTGLFFLEGEACWFGQPAEGVIVLPCLEADLPVRFARRGPD